MIQKLINICSEFDKKLSIRFKSVRKKVGSIWKDASSAVFGVFLVKLRFKLMMRMRMKMMLLIIQNILTNMMRNYKNFFNFGLHTVKLAGCISKYEHK